jgi:hypothetical protein
MQILTIPGVYALYVPAPEILKTIILQSSESGAIDTYISSINPSLNFANSNNLIMGKDSVGAKYRILIKPTGLNLIPGGARLETAEIRLKCNLANDGIYTAHEILDSWVENINWSGQPNFDSTPIQTLNINGGVNNWYTIDIYDLVKDWLISKPNYGILIKADNENIVNNISFYSSNYSNDSFRPIYYYQYTVGKKRKSLFVKESFKGRILV